MFSGAVAIFLASSHHFPIMANLPGSKAEIAEVAIEERKRSNRLAAQIKNLKAQGQAAAERTMTVAIGVGAAAGAGFLAKQYPGQWMSVDKEIWLGGGLLALGMIGLGGPKMSDPMIAAGSGILSAYAYNRVRNG